MGVGMFRSKAKLVQLRSTDDLNDTHKATLFVLSIAGKMPAWILNGVAKPVAAVSRLYSTKRYKSKVASPQTAAAQLAQLGLVALERYPWYRSGEHNRYFKWACLTYEGWIVVMDLGLRDELEMPDVWGDCYEKNLLKWLDREGL